MVTAKRTPKITSLSIICIIFINALLITLILADSTTTDDSCTTTTTKTARRRKRPPTVILDNEEIILDDDEYNNSDENSPPSPFEKIPWGDDDNDNYYYKLLPNKDIRYVPNFLNTTTSTELINFCRDRFVRSPIRGGTREDDATTTTTIDGHTAVHAHRTSESCILVPAFTYLSNPRFQTLRTQPHLDDDTREVIRQVDVAWEVSRRAASLLSWDASRVEPLQLVKYASPEAYYKVHHDHGGYYGTMTLEQRRWTVLVFLNDVSVGGYTNFPLLGLSVVPRGGDALAWENVVVGEDVVVDEDMVHAGEPPGEVGVEKYAVNIWLGEREITGEDLRSGRWTEEEEGR